jgi:hypothetical protein
MPKVRKGYVVNFGERFWGEGEEVPPHILPEVLKNQSWKFIENIIEEEILDGEQKEERKEDKSSGQKKEIKDIANNRMIDKSKVKVK